MLLNYTTLLACMTLHGLLQTGNLTNKMKPLSLCLSVCVWTTDAPRHRRSGSRHHCKLYVVF